MKVNTQIKYVIKKGSWCFTWLKSEGNLCSWKVKPTQNCWKLQPLWGWKRESKTNGWCHCGYIRILAKILFGDTGELYNFLWKRLVIFLFTKCFNKLKGKIRKASTEPPFISIVSSTDYRGYGSMAWEKLWHSLFLRR